MPLQDYNRAKGIAPTTQNDSGTTQNKAQAVLLVGGDDQTTGTGDIVIDFANISDAQDIAVYDQDGNLLDYEIEELDTSITIQTADGFEDGDFTSNPTWTEVQTGGTATVQSSVVKEGSNALELSTSGTGGEIIEHDRGSSDSISDNDRYHFWYQAGGTAGDQANKGGFMALTNTQGGGGNSGVDAIRIQEDGEFNIATYDNSGSQIQSTAITETGATTEAVWYEVVVELIPSSSEAAVTVYDSNGTNILGTATVSTSGASNLQYVQLGHKDFETGSVYFDRVSYDTTSTETVSGAETAVLHCYNSWTRDDSVQAQIAYGDNSANEDRSQDGTGGNAWNNTGQNAMQVYHYNESSGQLIDSSPNNKDSISTTGTTFDVSGQFDGARGFDGTDDIIQIPKKDQPTAITIVGYVNHDSLTSGGVGGQQRYVSSFDPDAGASGGEVILDTLDDTDTTTADAIRLLIADGSGTFQGASADNQLTTGTWYQIAGTYDSTNGFDIYKDGSGVASDTTTFTIPSSTNDFGIAEDTVDSNPQEFFDGSMDALRIYEEKKSSAWLQADYDASPKAGQVYFSQQAAESTSLQIAAETSTAQATNPEPAVQATGAATVKAQESTATTSNPEPAVNATGTTTIQAQESTATTSNPEPTLAGTGTATLNAATSTVSATNPEPNLSKIGEINAPVSTATTSNPEPNISGTGNATLEAETSTAQATIQEPTISGSGKATITAEPSEATATNPEPTISGSGSISIEAEPSTVSVLNPEPTINIALQPRDISFTTSIKTESDETVSGDIDK